MVDILQSDKSDRALIYKVLSDCFYAPDKSLLMGLAVLDGAVGEYFLPVLDAFKKDTKEEVLKVDYSRLFLGPYKLLAPPYGSVYLDGNNNIMGESTIKVKDCYRNEGLGLAFKEIPDHITVELEFMHFLSTKELEALADSNTDDAKRYRKAQSDFLQNYLAPWMKEFCERINKNTQTTFYKKLASTTKSFINAELKLFA